MRSEYERRSPMARFSGVSAMAVRPTRLLMEDILASEKNTQTI
jgi:hypothetical protein